MLPGRSVPKGQAKGGCQVNGPKVAKFLGLSLHLTGASGSEISSAALFPEPQGLLTV